MLNYVKKFTMEILPSVAATIIGAYIVNHYIVTKPAADAPVAAAVSAADPKGNTKTASESKPAETSADAGNLPAAGVKAKGMSERTLLERSAAEKAAVIEKPQEKLDAKSAGAKPVDAKSPILSRLTPSPPTRRSRPRASPPIRAVIRLRRATRSGSSFRLRCSPRCRRAPVAAVPSPAAPVEAAVGAG